jgi:hypothetical protein
MQNSVGLWQLLTNLFASPEVTVVADRPDEVCEDLRWNCSVVAWPSQAHMLLELRPLWCDFWLRTGPSLPRRKLLPHKVNASDMARTVLGKPLDDHLQVRFHFFHVLRGFGRSMLLRLMLIETPHIPQKALYNLVFPPSCG